MHHSEAEAIVKAAAKRSSLKDALEWIAEGRPTQSSPGDGLLTALVVLSADNDKDVAGVVERALQRAVRQQVHSRRDSGMELVDLDQTTAPLTYRDALDEVCRHTPSGDLCTVTADSVRAAQAVNGAAIEALCAVAGLSFKELREECAGTGLPIRPDGKWTQRQMDAAFKVIDEIVEGKVITTNSNASARRPVEMLLGPPKPMTGWKDVQKLYANGVPYELLLAQRAVGGAWMAHQNSTGHRIQQGIVDEICGHFDRVGVTYTRVSRDGAGRKSISKVRTDGASGRGVGQVSVLVGPDSSWYAAIAVSVAGDGGTASKSGKALRALPALLTVPLAAVVVGPGWAGRQETVDLVKELQGRVFTEQTLDSLRRRLASAEAVSGLGQT